MNIKYVAVAAAVVVIGIGAWFFLSAQDGGPLLSRDDTTAVATVNGEAITQAELDAFQAQVVAEQGIDANALDAETTAQLRTQVLESLVAQVLIEQAIVQSGVAVDTAAIDSQISTIQTQFEDAAAYQAALAAEGLTESALRDRISTDLAAQAYFERTLDLASVSATEEEIVAAYDEAASAGEVPPLPEVRTQVETLIVQQKQQALIAEHVDALRAAADIEVLR